VAVGCKSTGGLEVTIFCKKNVSGTYLFACFGFKAMHRFVILTLELCFVFLGKIIPFTVCGHQNPGAIQIARVYPSLYKVDFFL
jgi:hypothetical protein